MASPAAGKTVIITGAAGGLGKALATAFLEAGANVAIFDVNPTRLQETTTEWSSKHSSDKFLASEVNITDESAVNAFFSAAAAKFGRVDMLINNAGVMDTFDGAGSCPLDTWNRVIGVNLTGAFLCTKAAVSAFEEQQQSQPGVGGTIINIASVASTRGISAGAAYTASKHGLVGLVKNTASYYGSKGIYSIALLMGGMDTNIYDAFATGYNAEGMAAVTNATPGYVQGKTNVQLGDVARYCLFFSDPTLAEVSNGALIPLNKNWPAA
ncbi:hypothetical protein F4777DRAFT_383930 [Nemania sp. FL0916]|nr:hypothetical protein F4777DRAFT_383930 [Nemania sp. FL0916]